MPAPLAPRAKELTPEEAQQRREEAFALNERIKRTILEGREAAWKLAAYLDLFDERVCWSALQYESQNDWLADPEIGLTRTTYHRLVDTYRFLMSNEIEPTVIKQLEPSKIDVALPAVRQGRANLADVIDDVKALSKSDLREKYRDPAAATGPTGGTTVHAEKPPLPPDSEPVQASELEGDIEVLDADGEPLSDPTGEVSELVDLEMDGSAYDGEGEAQQRQKGDHPLSGVISDDLRAEATELRGEVQQFGLSGVSDAMRLHMFRKVDAFLAKLVGDAGP